MVSKRVRFANRAVRIRCEAYKTVQSSEMYPQADAAHFSSAEFISGYKNDHRRSKST